MRRTVFISLFSLFSLWGCGQFGLMVDTASSNLPEPPDIAQSFTVTKTATDTFVSLKSEIRSYWTLEETAGNAVDSVGTVDLPVYGSVTREQTGKIGDCYSFTSSSYLGPIDTYFEFNGSFTISCWFSTTSTTAWDAIMSCFGATNYGWELLTVGDPIRVLYWRMRYSGDDATIQGTTDINDGTLYHVAASYNAVDDTMKLWLDGVLEGSIKNTNGTWYNSEARFHIGSRLAGGYFEGKIDEPATWNKELTYAEVNALAGEDQYPFTEGSGGDSLNMEIDEPDTRADTFRVIWNYEGDGEATDEDDGNELFAFNVSEISEYADTTFLWPHKKDTIIILTLCSGLDPEDIWVLQHDTVLVDSSDISPPDQDIGIWDSIYANDFEQHNLPGGSPIRYSRDLFLVDYPNATYLNGLNQWRADDTRYPQWYADNIKDSIVIDPISGSKVLRLMYAEGIHDGYDGQSGRGGDNWKIPLPGGPYLEVYASMNIMLRPDWDFSAGGKLTPAIMGGTNPSSGSYQPGYGDGFWVNIIWGWDQRNDDLWGVPGTYMFHQDQPHAYGQWFAFDDFNPEGDGLTGRYNADNGWVIPSETGDSVWFNITFRVVVNTHTGSTPNYDGIFEGYINGHLICQVSGLYLITYPDIGKEINYWQFYQSFGGGGPPLRDEWSFNDDIWVFTYDVSVDVPRGNELSEPGRVLSLPNWPKPQPPEE
jgi:hypothetical protein